MCGEQLVSPLSCGSLGGSPPRVRGTDSAPVYIPQADRITPACAGNSIIPQQSPSSPKDHPRVCGEQFFAPTHFRPSLGSPPRVRGTVLALEFHDFLARITPACAGNSFILRFNQILIWDHPRVCGEQREVRPQVRAILGSPPRVRGTGSNGAPMGWQDGITPACAGNSFH